MFGREGWNHSLPCPYIVDLVSALCALTILEGPKANLEIETRPGEYFGGMPEERTVINHLSNYSLHPFSVDYSLPKDLKTSDTYLQEEYKQAIKRLNPYQYPLESMSEVKVKSHSFSFEPAVPEVMFHSRLEIFNHYSARGGKFMKAPATFTIDFTPKGDPKDSRVTFDLNTGKMLRTFKKYKSKVDLNYYRTEFRLAAAIEVNEELTPEQFYTICRECISSNQISYMRVKLRQNFEVEKVLEVSFTKVFELNRESKKNKSKNGKDEQPTELSKEATAIDHIKVLLSEFAKKPDEQHEQISEEQRKAALITLRHRILSFVEKSTEAKHELEIEYKAIDRLIANYKSYIYPDNPDGPPTPMSYVERRVYFASKIENLLFNSQVLFYQVIKQDPSVDDILFNTQQKTYFFGKAKEQFVEFSVIGGYLEKILGENKIRDYLREQRQQAKKQNTKMLEEHPNHQNGAAVGGETHIQDSQKVTGKGEKIVDEEIKTKQRSTEAPDPRLQAQIRSKQ